jgi:hypothetical protein
MGSNARMSRGADRPSPRRRARVRGLAAAAALAGLAGLPAVVAGDVDDRVTRTVAVPAGGTIVIEASNAIVHVAGSDRQDLGLEVVRRAPTREDLPRFPVLVEQTGGRTRIAVVQAGTDARLQATIRLDVPRGAVIERLLVAEGRLEIADLTGAVTADVRRGPIAATRVSGVLRLETGIGDVTVEQARLVPEGLIRLRTFNGDIRLAFAEAPADARVMALALNGTVTSQIPLHTKTAWGPRWAETTIGRGEPVVSLDVVSGAIRIEAPGRRP